MENEKSGRAWGFHRQPHAERVLRSIQRHVIPIAAIGAGIISILELAGGAPVNGIPIVIFVVLSIAVVVDLWTRRRETENHERTE